MSDNTSDGAEMPQDTWSGALGVFPTVTMDGVEYSFAIDTPGLLVNLERLCKEWGRARFRDQIEALEDRNRPGTLDYDIADRVTKEHLDEIKNGYYTPPTGGGFSRFMESPEGKLAPLVAALRVKHKDATAALVMRMMAADPVRLREVAMCLGKVVSQTTRMMATTETTPAPSG